MNREISRLTFCSSNWAFASLVIVAAIFVLIRTSVADAHGVVGNRIFLSPIVGNDAFPDNALNLATHRSDYQFSLIPAFEKQLSANSSLLFVRGWERISPGHGQQATTGFSGLVHLLQTGRLYIG